MSTAHLHQIVPDEAPESDLALAEWAARSAGHELRSRFREPLTGFGRKQTVLDYVSDADRAAEQAALAVIDRFAPADAILAEEGGSRAGSTGRTWIIDPLDGTAAYVRGLVPWAVSIALSEPGDTHPSLGVVYDVMSEECWTVAPGEPVRRNGTPVGHERWTDDLSECQMMGTLIMDHDDHGQAERSWRALRSVGRARDCGSAAVALAWLAAGRIDLVYYESRLYEWDIAGGVALCVAQGMIAERLDALVEDPTVAPFICGPPDLVAQWRQKIGI